MDLFKNFKFKNWLIFVIVLFLFLTYEGIFLLFNVDLNHLSVFELYFITFSKYITFAIFFIIYYHRYLKEKWFDFIRNFKKYFVISFKDWLTGFLIMYVSNSIIMRIIGSVGQNEETVQTLIHSTPIIALILTTIFAPFIEELIFRKNLQDCFHHKFLFMIMSGLLFGLVHVLGASNPLEYLLIISYGAVGFMFAHTLNKTDNVYCPIMMHAIHNCLLTILSIVVNL